MLKRTLAILLISILSLMGLKATAQEKKSQPTLALRFQSINRLQENIYFLAESVGKKEEARQVEGLLKLMTGPKGLEGIDPEKPFGLYGYLGPNIVDSDVVGLIPIADEKAFLDMLKKLNLPANKGDGEIYTVNIPNSPFPLLFRFKNGYMCATVRDEKAISDKTLLAPKDILQPEKTGVLSLTLNIAGIPDDLIKNIVPQIELMVAQAKQNKKPNETPVETKLREETAEYMMQTIVQLLTQGEEFMVKLDMDRKSGDIELAVGLEGKKGTDLAKGIAGAGAQKSLGAAIRGKNSALHAHLNALIPDYMKKEIIRSGLEEAGKVIAAEKDEGKKKAAKELLDAMTPALQKGLIDVAADIQIQPNGKYGFLLAAQMEKSSKLEDWVKNIHKELPDAEKKKLEINQDKEGSVNLHKITFPMAPEDEKLFGSGTAYVAFAENKILFAVGENARQIIGTALKATPVSGAMMEFELSFLKASGLMTKQFSKAREVAEKIFKETPEADKIKYSLSAGEKLSLKVGIKSTVLGFMKAAGEEAKK